MSAIFSPCRTWRYRLEREIADVGIVAAIIGVNPSVAAEDIDDATIRKDMGFGRRLGWRRLIKGNLFAFCSTDIRGLRTATNPKGPENDAHLDAIFREADQVIFAWGPTAKLPPALRKRWRTIAHRAFGMGIEPMCFGVANDGQPRHTLMLSYDTPLEPWRMP